MSVCLCAGRRNEDARSCRGGASVMGTVRDLPCPHGQSAAANSASRRRRLTGKPATESNLSLSAPAQRAVRGGIGSFRACQRWAAVGLCCGQSLLSLRGDRRLVQPGLPRRTVPPQSGRSPRRDAQNRIICVPRAARPSEQAAARSRRSAHFHANHQVELAIDAKDGHIQFSA